MKHQKLSETDILTTCKVLSTIPITGELVVDLIKVKRVDEETFKITIVNRDFDNESTEFNELFDFPE